MSKQMTPWFPSSIKPVRAGVYEVFTPNNLANKYAYFDNKGWHLCASSVKEAKLESDWMDSHWESRASSMAFPRARWRGFTKEQK